MGKLRIGIIGAGGEEAPLITGSDATRTLAATLAVHRAAATGERIDLA